MSRHGPRPGRLAEARSGFRNWRRSRPFWGGFLVVVSGVLIVLAPLAPLPLLVEQGIAGVSGYLVGALLIALGLLTWFQPMQRTFFGIVAILLALASFVTSNFGGFVLGMLFGLVGGALTFAWVPNKRQPAATGEPGETEPDPTEEVDTVDGTHTSEDPPEGAVGGDREDGRKGERDSGDDDGREPPRIGNTGKVNSLVALPMALTLVLPAMVPADEGTDWPWDDWFSDGEESESEEPEPSPSEPPETPSPSPEESGDEESGSDTGGDGEDTDGEEGEEEEGEDEEEDSEEDEGDDESDCEIRVGDDSVAGSEEEFLEAVRDCQEERENGEEPDVGETEAEGDFIAATVPMGLTADKQVMSGAKFEGVVEYPTSEGTERYLKLTMDESEFTGAEQWYERGDSRTTLQLPDMTFTGDVVIHVTEMDVRILGIPLTFTPDFPPPLLLPYMVVTDVEVQQPLAQANEVVIDGLDQRVE
ncbi:DUF6114 domain-containing protein [Halostreptopolyspora alba]|uniref:Uncharacterized protein n=1 Tax=Halostreptopolyspora alba TaxID=2487137 RepID=A0A3N0ECG8_9ACTN|nr:hypothetical protein EFW17_08645 [Nocardiopsaceae bacterium YIM 96095]